MNIFSSTIHRVRIVVLIGCLFCCIAGFVPARRAKAQTGRTFDITLAELGYGDQTLRGPVAYTNYYFGLPADWELEPEGNYLDLILNYAVSGRDSYAPTLLEVQLNRAVLETIDFAATGVQQVRVELPLVNLRVSEDRLLNGLRVSLSVSTICEEAQLTSLTIEASSSFHLAYRERPLQLDLAQWPKPLYQWHAFDLSRVRLVLPAEPSAADVQAATIVAAGLGKLSNDNLPLAASLASEQTSGSFLDKHLIVIGQPEDNSLLDQFDLPLSLAQRQLKLSSRVPASVAPGQAFSYTLTVENTSSSERRLVVEDRLPLNGTLLGCLGRCQESEPGVLRWDVGSVVAGHQISTVVSVRLAASVSPGERVEHTASLLDDEGTVINVDTLAAEVGTTEDGQTITSASDKAPYFFVHDSQGVAEGEGLLQALVSPWSSRHAVIVVTGLGDEALLKAAHALGARARFPGMSGTYAVVQDVKSPSGTEPEILAEDVSLAALGYEDNVLGAAIFESLQYTFDVPREWALSQDSHLALHFAHSVALSEMSATLDVTLNDTPFGSIRLDDENATDTWVTLPLPTTSLLDGQNRLEMRVGARRDDVCVDLRNAHLWLTIYADSFLHLPSERTSLALDLQGFPRPFSDSGDLSQVAFLLPRQPTIEELEGVLRLASRLGNAARGDDFWPQVLLGGDPQSHPQEGYDVIAIGRPTQNPFIAAVNDQLPHPFFPDTDEIRQQVDHVIYRLPPGISLGFVQELLSPWDEGRAMLVATGTTDEGVIWAVDALTNRRLNWQLAGNLALVREDRVETVDTREETESVGQVTQAFVPELPPEATVAPTPTAATVPATPAATSTVVVRKPSSDQAVPRATARRPVWLVLLLIVAIAAAAVGVGLTVRQAKS